MPVSSAIRGGVLHVRCVGEYGADEVIACFDRALASDELPQRAEVLLDMREAQSLLRRPSSDLRRVALHFVPHAARFNNRCALLVEGLARYGLMRMAAAWVGFEGVEAKIFRSESEALAWLGERAD